MTHDIVQFISGLCICGVMLLAEAGWALLPVYCMGIVDLQKYLNSEKMFFLTSLHLMIWEVA